MFPGVPPEIAPFLAERKLQLKRQAFRVYEVADLVLFAAAHGRGSEAPYWAIVWEASMALGEWLLEHPEFARGRSMLELGCGLGLSGVVAASLGGRVTQTDRIPEALGVAAENARRNGLEPPPRQFQADWNTWSHEEKYDVLFGSDLVYEPSVNPALLKIFRRNLAPGGELLIAAPLREPMVDLMDRLLNEGWSFTEDSRMIPWQRRVTEIAIWRGSPAAAPPLP